ncbi:MAG: helix-turn-helix domain-containing protein [Gemmobacter sp.]
MTDLPRPPAQVEPYVRVLGTDLAIEFLLEFGGAELSVNQRPQPRGRLARLVGIERARALGAVAGDLPRRVPLAKPWIAAVWRTRGLPVAEIARRLHASYVSVRRWLAAGATDARRGAPADPRQLRLF